MGSLKASNPFVKLEKTLEIGAKSYTYFDLPQLGNQYSRLPYSIRVLLESAVRNCDEIQVSQSDVENILAWESNQNDEIEVQFKPARVILMDCSGVPTVVDLAAMRDVVNEMGKNYELVNPICPTAFVIDHSIQVDYAGTPDALEKNEALEFERNTERFKFLKWGAKAFKNMLIVPPGSGIMHQVNLEYLAKVAFSEEGKLYPDSVVGNDSHTTMVNALGVCGWGVGGIEAAAVMMGLPISLVLPQVVGYRLTGELSQHVTSTDLVLTINKNLRQVGVVGKFVEFFGSGVSTLSIQERATISNMCPEYGATAAFFPVDDSTIQFLRLTGRAVNTVEMYLKAVGLFRDDNNNADDPAYSQIVELDLSTVVPCVSGPKRPHDRVAVSDMKSDFQQCLTNKIGFKGYGIPSEKTCILVPFKLGDKEYTITNGSVLIAAIASSTNSSNPSVLLGAGLLAKRAVEAGLSVAPYIKTSLSPGSRVVKSYLQDSGFMPYLQKLGFDIVGYGCMTCIGLSGPLPEPVVEAVEKGDLVGVGVLSGNRNFEGRIHPNLRANYLASPLLVVAYAIAGTVNIDFETEPIGKGTNGPVYLRDIWPLRNEIRELEQKHVRPEMYADFYSNMQQGNNRWNELEAPEGMLYPWDDKSNYIKHPPFFQGMTMELPQISSINWAHVLLNLGDSITTDHISPAGNIAKGSSAARYLLARGVSPQEFNTYGSRRGNDAVMVRGCFANIRLVNKLISKAGPRTLHFPDEEEMDIFEAAEKYKEDGKSVVILAGKEYGAGSSRDWAAKGPYLLGVKAIIAESFERIHRSNLVGMGILPLQFVDGQNADNLGLSGKKTFDIPIPNNIQAKHSIDVTTSSGKTFTTTARIDTTVEVACYKNGGILPYMIRKIVSEN